jgi:hypothetical protein
MSFKVFKSSGKELIINTDRIVSVSINAENGKAVISCTDQIVATVDDSEEELKKILGVKVTDGKVGFRSS